MVKKSLKNILPGETCRITKISAKGEIKHRLLEMGIHVGEKVEVQRIAPLGDPMKIKIKKYNLSLRKSEADMIEVDTITSKKLKSA